MQTTTQANWIERWTGAKATELNAALISFTWEFLTMLAVV